MKKLRYYSKLGIEVRVYSPNYKELMHSYPDWKSYQGDILPHIKVVPFPSQAAGLGEFSNDSMVDPKPFAGKAITDDILSFKPDIIHVDSPERLFFGMFSLPGKKAAEQLNIPIVAFYRTHFVQVLPKLHEVMPWTKYPGVFGFLHRLNVWLYKRYPVVLTASNNTQDQLNSWGVHNTKVGKLLGVELDRFSPSEELFRDPSQTLRIISVSRYDPDKNIGWLLELCQKIHDLNIGCEFTFVGDGLDSDKVSAWVEDKDCAEFVGSVPNHETVSYYQQADIFITAATHETFGTTLIEAAACGLALIGFREGAVMDRIEHDANGYLVETQDYSEALSHVLALHHDRTKLLQLKRRSIEIANEYRNETTADNLLKIWREEIDCFKS